MLQVLTLTLFLVYVGGSWGQTQMVVKVGERVKLPCRLRQPNNPFNMRVSWFKMVDHGEDDLLYRFWTGSISYLDKDYEIEHDPEFKLWHNLTVKSITKDNAGRYQCIHENTSPYKVADFELIVNGSLDFGYKNMVVPYYDMVQLPFVTELDHDASVQWLHTNRSSILRQIYHATSYRGGVLPEYEDEYQEAGPSYGIIIDSLTYTTTGRYKYLVVDPPSIIAREFSLTGIDKLSCSSLNYVIEGRLQTHSCYATVSVGTISPDFTWYKDGEPVEGTLTEIPENSLLGTRWQYDHSFIGDSSVQNSVFNCTIQFRYDGTPSKYEDTSNPAYAESCLVTYPIYQYPVEQISITPSSQDGEPFPILVGQHLLCEASGFPQPSFNFVCDGFYLTYRSDFSYLWITDEMVNEENLTCTCTASNRLSDGSYHSLDASVTVVAAHSSGVLHKPKDKVVRVGESAKLECTIVETDDNANEWDVQWVSEFSKGYSNILYYSDLETGGVLTEWLDDFSDGDTKHDLVLKKARYELAGSYFCQEIYYPDINSWKAEVAVTSSPTCTRTAEGENVIFNCQLEYSGNLESMMQWTDDAGIAVDSQGFMTRDAVIHKEHSITVPFHATEGYKCEVIFYDTDKKPIFSDGCSV